MRVLVLVRVLDQIPAQAQAQALMLALLQRECGFYSHHTASPIVHSVSNTLCSRMLLEVLLCPGRDTLQHGPSWCLSRSYHTPCPGVLTLQWRCLQRELDVLYFHRCAFPGSDKHGSVMDNNLPFDSLIGHAFGRSPHPIESPLPMPRSTALWCSCQRAGCASPQGEAQMSSCIAM